MASKPSEVGSEVRPSIDFTSSLYLGIAHPSRSLRPWARLTTGKPAALETPPSARALSQQLARLQDCERTILLPSTLHLFFDLFELLRREEISIFVDAGAYPIARWAAERATSHGVPLRQIAHYRPKAARLAIEKAAGRGRRPVILVDGFCPECGRPAPLREYLECIEPHGGYVVLDDTQALGIWGAAPGPENPYGTGGGGSLRLHAIRSPQLILGSSLAKGFGAPLAALSGSARLVERFARVSRTRVHCSAPSIAVLRAAEHAMHINTLHGDALRRRLARLVRRFRDNIVGAGLHGGAGLFPVQMLVPEGDRDAVRLQRLLRSAGVRTAVVRGLAPPRARLTFVINASHTSGDIDRATGALLAVVQSQTSC